MPRNKLSLLSIALILALYLTISCGTLQQWAATPTNTPTVTPTMPLDLSKVVLTHEDLPSGFIAIPLDQLGITTDDLGGDDFKIESTFTFLEASNFEYVMGFTTLLLTALEQAGFDTALSHPDLMITAFATGLGVTEISEIEELANLDDIGEISAGYTMTVVMIGIPMHMDLAIFRRDVVGAMALVIYVEGNVPVVTVGDVARKMDARIVETLHLTP